MKLSTWNACGIVLLALAYAPAARAVSVTYTYTGGLCNVFFGYGHPGDHQAGTVSFEIADPSLLYGRAFGPMPTASSWSISDGQRTRTSGTWFGDALMFRAATNGVGDITAWDLKLTIQGGALVAVASVSPTYDQSSDLTPLGGTWTGGQVYALAPVGSWTMSGVTPVPEPASAVMLALGLALIALARRLNA